MIQKLIILHGCPGSGKSTLINQWMDNDKYNDEVGENDITNRQLTSYNSTDKYWIRPDGRYDFNFKLLGAAHGWNQDRVEQSLSMGIMYVVVDNTNLTWQEILPYVQMAKKYKYEVEVWESDTPWRYDAEELAKRNTHGVPLESIKRMLAKKESVESLREKVRECLEN